MRKLKISLLSGVLATTSIAWFALLFLSRSRTTLFSATIVFLCGSSLILWANRKTLAKNRFYAFVTLTSLMLLLVSVVVALCDRFLVWELFFASSSRLKYLVISTLSLAAAAYAWKGSIKQTQLSNKQAVANGLQLDIETVPSDVTQPSPELFEETAAAIKTDPTRLRMLQVLMRINAHARDIATKKIVSQECKRLVDDYRKEQHELSEADLLSRAVTFIEWGVQKYPELKDLDISDLLMAKTVADIRNNHDFIKHIYVDFRLVVPLHGIDRDSAIKKCQSRAESIKRALPVIRENGFRLSEEFIVSQPELQSFKSISGFQVIQFAEEKTFVAFEGNGRLFALAMALKGSDPLQTPLQIEVRQFCFEDQIMRNTIERRIRRVRKYKGQPILK